MSDAAATRQAVWELQTLLSAAKRGWAGLSRVRAMDCIQPWG